MADSSPSSMRGPSRPRARWWGLALVYVVLLAIACAAIWWIDRGAMMNNASVDSPPPQARP